MTPLAASPPDSSRIGRSGTGWDVARVRADFPILTREVRGRPLVYLDNAATAQKPAVVIEAMERDYKTGNADVRRGGRWRGREATREYERVRELAAKFLGAGSASEIVFTSGTTAALNLVAQGSGDPVARAGRGRRVR